MKRGKGRSLKFPAAKDDSGGMETTAQLIAAFDNQHGRRSHGQRIRSSQQSALTAHDLKRKLTLAGVAVAVALVCSLFLVF